MRLEITLVAGSVPPDKALQEPVELGVRWPPGADPDGCSGVSLRKAMERQWPGFDFTVAGQRLDCLQPGSAPLCNGAVVVAWPVGGMPRFAAVSEASDSGAVALLAVCSGPAAGTVFTLRRGSYSLGRGMCRLHLPDPALSRHHGTIVLGSQSVTLTAAPGSSGFLLHRTSDGPTASAERVRGAVSLTTGQRISCGNSQIELRLPGAVEGGSPDHGVLNLAGTAPIAVPNPSGSARDTVAMLLMGLLPLLLGTALAIFTGSVMFLAFAAMGAMAVLVPLLGGARRRRVFREHVDRAVRQDAERAALTFPDAAVFVLAASHPGGGPPPSPSGSSVAAACETASAPAVTALAAASIAVRLGLASRAGQIAPEPPDASFTPPRLRCQPFVVPLGVEPLTVRGPDGPVLALLNFVLMQLDAAAVPVVLTGPADSIPWTARFLPLTVLATSAAEAQKALAAAPRSTGNGPDPPPCVLLRVGGAGGPGLTLPPGTRSMHFEVDGEDAPPLAQPSPVPPSSVGASTVWLRVHGAAVAGSLSGQEFVPDGVPPAVFAGHARRRAGLSAHLRNAADASLSINFAPPPGRCTTEALSAAWAASAGGPLRPVPVGHSRGGPTLFSFRDDGPHLLVGGTTGSGKSEFLRALVASLAAAHSPADLQFVFIDFKGGAGLGALGKLPHTSSLVTDLGGHGMDRTLASLRAELHAREAALSAVEAADSLSYRGRARLAGLPAGVHAMAHLVVVVDEFRVLVDQFPDAMAELMRIAAVGRSLGIHLVMATQRPQGAVNADIRANVTSSICLRVQSSFDSVDVIGSGVAAGIAVDSPGRAYISRAGGAPEEFQSAVLGLPPTGADLLPVVERVDELRNAPGRSPLPSLAGAGGIDEVAEAMSLAWEGARTRDASLVAAPPVVAPELPSEMLLPRSGGVASGRHASPEREAPGEAGTAGLPGTAGQPANQCLPGAVMLGVVDLPEQQHLSPLLWHPLHHSHLACLGTGSETSSAVALTAGQVLAANAHQSACDELDATLLYLLDADGSLKDLAGNPWVGSYLTPEHLRTVGRLVSRLGEAAKTSPHPLLLCISDWGRWTTALRASPWHEAEDAIAELVRFGGKNFTVVVGGARELLTAGFMAAVPNRLFLSLGSPAESTMLWPRIPQFAPLPGRAAVDGPINPAAAGAPCRMHVAQLGLLHPQPRPPTQLPQGHHAAQTLRLGPLPESLLASDVAQFAARGTLSLPAAPSGSSAARDLVLGMGGDGSDPVRVRLEPGTVLAVVGGPQTGKSSFLRMLASFNGATMLGNGRPGLGIEDSVDGSSTTTAGAGQVLLLDNPLSLPPGQLQSATNQLAAGAALVVSLQYPGPALSRLPLEWGLRTLQQGVVVRPQRAMDAELFGVRLDTAGSEPPGRAVLLDGNRCEWFQFPHCQD